MRLFRRYTLDPVKVDLLADYIEAELRVDPVKSEAVCEYCRGTNPVWYADSGDWNRVVPEEINFLCPRCFILVYEQATGERLVWSVLRSGASPTDEALRLAREAGTWLTHAVQATKAAEGAGIGQALANAHTEGGSDDGDPARIALDSGDARELHRRRRARWVAPTPGRTRPGALVPSRLHRSRALVRACGRPRTD